ncbi:MAG: hypothetical protein AB7G47_19910 [Mycolicibacterium sp.]|uniref:hypothetical protein n=1 Tax=Mycolicibacterium sp. TaxID=2320850 RepID=UPI003D0B2810
MTGSLRFRRQCAGCYWTQTDRHSIRLLHVVDPTARLGRVNYWEVSIRETIETAGVKHALGQPICAHIGADTYAEAKRVAHRFTQIVGDTPAALLVTILRRAAGDVVEQDLAAARAALIERTQHSCRS